MANQIPIQLVRGFTEPGVMDPAGTHEGNVALFLSKQNSAYAAQLLYQMHVGTVARILRPEITKPTHAQAILAAVATMNPPQVRRAIAGGYHGDGGDGCYSGSGSSHHGGQALGVAAGDGSSDRERCVFENYHACTRDKDGDGNYNNPSFCYEFAGYLCDLPSESFPK